MKRFWVRFMYPGDAPRPSAWAFRWWITGATWEPAPRSSVCAVVDAADWTHVLGIVRQAWPRVKELDFCDEKPAGWMPARDRFPLDGGHDRT